MPTLLEQLQAIRTGQRTPGSSGAGNPANQTGPLDPLQSAESTPAPTSKPGATVQQLQDIRAGQRAPVPADQTGALDPLQPIPGPPVDPTAVRVGRPPGRDLSGYPSIGPLGPGVVLRRVAETRAEIEATVAGELEKITVIYGRQRVGGKIANVVASGGDLLVHVVWCCGGQAGIQEIEDITVDGKSWADLIVDSGTLLPPSVASFGVFARTDYLGTTTQTADADLAAAITGYADTLVVTNDEYSKSMGIAYSVLRFPSWAKIDGLPELVATIKGLKVYDPRATGHDPDDPSTWAYSANPALCLADFETSVFHGRGRTVDWTAAGLVADDNDTLVAGNPRATIGYAINDKRATRDVVEAMRTYAQCFVVDEGGTSKLVSDRPAASARSITKSEIVAGSLRPSRRDMSAVPTVVRVRYTDTSQDPWRDAFATAYASGVLAGTTPWRESDVPLPGINNHPEAYRAAVYRLNVLSLTDLDVTFDTQDEALGDLAGDVIDITHDIGLTSKELRITNIDGRRAGRWTLTCAEYQAATYTDAVVHQLFADTNLPDPRDVGAVANLSVVEKLWEDSSGHIHSRLELMWDRLDSSFVTHYLVKITSDNEINRHNVSNGLETVIKTVSGNVTPGVEYTVHVCAATTVGFGAANTATVTATGKSTSPGPPTALTAEQVGEFVFLGWTPPIDPDVSGYPIRRGTTAQSVAAWDSLTVVSAKADTDTFLDVGVPVGIHRYFVRSADSRYKTSGAAASSLSVTAATVDIEVSAGDSVSAFTSLGGDITTTSEMSSRIRSGLTWYETDTAQAWTDRWTIANSWASQTPASPWAVPTGTKTSVYCETEEIDFGEDIGGVWSRQFTADLIGTSGTYTVTLYLASAAAYAMSPPDWTEYVAGSVKANARYAKVRVTDTGPTTAALAVRDDITVSVATEVVQEGNLITLGDFASWQEGTSIAPTASVREAADLWYCRRQSDQGDWTVAQQPGRPNGRSLYSLRARRDNATTTTGWYSISFALEEEVIALLWGSRVTVDFWVSTGVTWSTKSDANYPAINLHTNNVGEGNWDLVTGVGVTTQERLLNGGAGMPDLNDGANDWQRVTYAFPNPIADAEDGLVLEFINAPAAPDTAGSTDWWKLSEVQLLRGVYTPANVPDFTTDDIALSLARVARYLRFSESTGQAAEFAHSMRATPTETGAGPYTYDARL